MYHYYEKLEQFSFLTQHLPFCSLPPNLTEYAILVVPKASSFSYALNQSFTQILSTAYKDQQATPYCQNQEPFLAFHPT